MAGPVVAVRRRMEGNSSSRGRVQAGSGLRTCSSPSRLRARSLASSGDAKAGQFLCEFFKEQVPPPPITTGWVSRLC